jgi:hypothetical protein
LLFSDGAVNVLLAWPFRVLPSGTVVVLFCGVVNVVLSLLSKGVAGLTAVVLLSDELVVLLLFPWSVVSCAKTCGMTTAKDAIVRTATKNTGSRNFFLFPVGLDIILKT